MIRIAALQWDKNKDLLREKLATGTNFNVSSYLDLVKLTFDVIFNTNYVKNYWSDRMLNINKITEIDDGQYQGTLMYVIPFDTYQPGADEYLMTCVSYGSCSGCDTLQYIKMLGTDYSDDALLTEQQITAFMSLCKDLIANTIKPYNYGWRYDPDFAHTEGLNIDS